MWVWVFALLLVALLVWLVGQRVRESPHVEIGVTVGEELPVIATPLPTADERAAGGELKREEAGGESGGGGGGESATNPAVPVSPEPRR